VPQLVLTPPVPAVDALALTTELVEIAQTHCPNGHRLRPGQMVGGYGAHPDGGQRRIWICRACGAITWDKDR
jgi:hypothetical protein